MDILLNKNFNAKEEKLSFATRVSGLLDSSNKLIIATRSAEVLDIYQRKVRKVKSMDTSIEGDTMPFAFVVFKN